MKTAVFIDGANLSYACAKAGYRIDFKKLKKMWQPPLRLTYYTATLRKPDGDDPHSKIKDYLEYNGYSVVTKECKYFSDPLTGLTKVKGNMDIEIVVDMLTSCRFYDNLCLA